MKVNPHTDELLCGYIDGELSLRQQTEVQRLAARDPEVGKRLRQLQQSRNLIAALPRAEAPSEMLEQIKLTLERRTLLDERPSTSGTRAGSWHLQVRRFLAAAAMIALVGVLGGVVYHIVSPVAPTPQPGFMAVAGDPVPTAPIQIQPTLVAAADSGFSGRLELRTALIGQAESFIKATIENNGLSGYAELQDLGDRRVFHLTCNAEALNRLVGDLSRSGESLQAVALAVDTERFGEPVVVEPVTLAQTAKIINQDSTEARIEAAKDIAVKNVFARATPGREIETMIDTSRDVGLPSLDIPMPRLASNDPATKVIPAPPEGEMNASLTIVLLNTR